MSTPAAAFTAIPIIDVGPLVERGAAQAPEVAAAMGRAAHDVGFFYVTNHGCKPELIERLKQRTREFFALPTERKMQVYIGQSDNHRGYVPPGEEFFGGAPDTKEAFDLSLDLAADDPDARGAKLLGPNQWPDLPGFAADVMAYYDAVFAIGCRLIQGFAVALGEDAGYFDRFITKPPSQLRLMHYPINPTAHDEPGIGAHTDYECFTLLKATSPGLEVMNGRGEWIDAPPVPGAFVVNIGDMMEYWSGGALVATTHRVRKVRAERYSFPLFFNVDYATRVKPLHDAAGDAPGLVAGEHLYAQTIRTFRYLQDRLARGEIVMPEDALAPASFGQQPKRR
jgi:isopenicillin N synthase-like dioxygenase